MAQKFCGISQDLTSPGGAYERAHSLAREAVSLEKMKSGYVGTAIENLTIEGNFGSWLRDLFHRKKVTIHLHYYERLVRIVEVRAALSRRQIDHIEDLVRVARGRQNAFDESDMQPDLVGNRASQEASRGVEARCLA